MAGLVAAALAGGLAGAGEAAQRGLGELQKQQGAVELEELRNELAGKRETAIERLRQSGARDLAGYQSTLRKDEAVQSDTLARSRAVDEATGEIGEARRTAAAKERDNVLAFESRPEVLEAAAKKARAGAAGQIEVQKIKEEGDDRRTRLNNDAAFARTKYAVDGAGDRAATKKGASEKLPEVARMQLQDLAKDEDRLDAAIIKAQSDPGYDPKAPGIQELQNRKAQVGLQKLRVYAKHDLLDPEGFAAQVAAGGTMDDITKSLTQAFSIDAKYGDRFYKAIRDSGALERLAEDREAKAPKAAPAKSGSAAPAKGLVAATAPAVDRMEQETREIEQGKRRDYSPEVKAQMDQEGAARSARRAEGDRSLLEREQQDALRRSRELVGR